MGWKNIKEHYRIRHIVQVRDGEILIGSPYVSDLLTITKDGKVKWVALGASKNDDLARYFEAMTADCCRLVRLMDTPDTFSTSLPVYTYEGGDIIQKQCEAYGWPNVTHDGQVQYDNSFSEDRAKVVAWAKRNVGYGIESFTRRRNECLADAQKFTGLLQAEIGMLEKLNTEFPDIQPAN